MHESLIVICIRVISGIKRCTKSVIIIRITIAVIVIKITIIAIIVTIVIIILVILKNRSNNNRTTTIRVLGSRNQGRSVGQTRRGGGPKGPSSTAQEVATSQHVGFRV